MYDVLVESGTFQVNAERETVNECLRFIEQTKRIGYVDGCAFIKNKENNQVVYTEKLSNFNYINYDKLKKKRK
tara:strand:+ start:2148 stop:2366 length:219 start_codon:yes stop_codon:yes gene_type:complete